MMKLGQALEAELGQEGRGTRRTLERVPEDRLDWRPHPRSMTLGYLATHLANLPHWTVLTLGQRSLDLSPGGTPMPKLPVAAGREQLLATFDGNLAAARQALAAVSDDDLAEPWTLLNNGSTVFTLPRFAVVRGMVLNHMIHHRGQLTVYLRLNDVAVPGLYGPSADEPAF